MDSGIRDRAHMTVIPLHLNSWFSVSHNVLYTMVLLRVLYSTLTLIFLLLLFIIPLPTMYADYTLHGGAQLLEIGLRVINSVSVDPFKQVISRGTCIPMVMQDISHHSPHTHTHTLQRMKPAIHLCPDLTAPTVLVTMAAYLCRVICRKNKIRLSRQSK